MILTAAPRTSILLADGHPIVCEGLVRLIERESDLSCCGQANTLAGVRSLAAKHQPDLIIMDVGSKEWDGVELIKSLKLSCRHLRVLIFSAHDERVYVQRTLRAGALGFVPKDRDVAEVLKGIRAVLRGEVYVTRGLAALLLQSFATAGACPVPAGLEQLTNRELRVFQLLGMGRSTREIAGELNRSLKTIESHRENIKRKLGLRSAAALVNCALRWAQEGISVSDSTHRRTHLYLNRYRPESSGRG